MKPQGPRDPSARNALRARARASGTKRGGPPTRGPPRRASTGNDRTADEGAAELQRLFSRRLRACRSLGIPVPADARTGAPETLLHRVALLDRRIEVSLDLAGGRHFPAWEDPEEDFPEDDEDEAVETSS